ncbi:MFS general substrate transporter [Glarea lozoyensis ATCC 20868]|uniref:MFS general substrate transporter n=1 Tax=Glarea lozoyensis (strain ATCC 20868 / MF5171) TaxID=1116229 RepID=S3DX33_GLAL2|nr:MFS general substrate transporter [Glarea lozoyensis ATCC 20868]EPE36526.1 MFS general substrate transporter [Glarea lozoyensis ATCC 20868]
MDSEKVVVNDAPALEKKSPRSQNSTSSPDFSTGETDFTTISAAEDRRLTTKLDLKVIPILGLLYLICFLDRTNIANARLAGLEKGLDMPKKGFNTALWIFYIPFVLAEVPSNIILALPYVKPNLWLGGMTFILGILSMCQGLTHSYEGLLALRFLMGIMEASLPAGAGLLIASYYRKKELALRFCLFLSLGLLGSCFSGLLAYALMDLDGKAGLEGWQWIFIVEGLATIVFSFIALVFVPHFPAKDSWLSETDRSRLLARLEADKGEASTINRPLIKVLFDPRIWSMTLLFFCADVSAGSLSSFNPTIVSQLGWTARRAQVMTMPIWIVGIIGPVTSAFLAGRWNSRAVFLAPAIICSLVGWVIHYVQLSYGVRYMAQFLISLGTFIQMSLYIGWLSANLRGPKELGVGTAIILGVGNCANFVSSNIFITTEAPRYPTGFSVGMALTALALPVLGGVVLWFWMHNKKIRARMAAGAVLDNQVDFIYVI